MENTSIEHSSIRMKRTGRERFMIVLVSVLLIAVGVAAAFTLYTFISKRNAPPKTYYDYQLRTWKNALSNNPKDPNANTNVGYIYMKMGREAAGLRYFNTALRYDDKFVPALYNKGMYYKRNGQNDEAIKLLKQAGKLAGQDSKYLAYFSLGEVYAGIKKYDLAKEAYEKAIADNSTIWNSYSQLGKVYELENDMDKALENYKKALAFNPDDAKTKRKVRELENGKR